MYLDVDVYVYVDDDNDDDMPETNKENATMTVGKRISTEKYRDQVHSGEETMRTSPGELPVVRRYRILRIGAAPVGSAFHRMSVSSCGVLFSMCV